MILIVTSDEIIGKCVLRVFKKNGIFGQLSKNVIEAIRAVDECVPNLIFLDVFLTGPDGFTFLNEMNSYADTMKVPVVLMGEKDFSKFNLSAYNVVGFLNKNTMKPEEILKWTKI